MTRRPALGSLGLLAAGALIACGPAPPPSARVAPAAVEASPFTDDGLAGVRQAIDADLAGDRIAGAVALLYAAGEVRFFESFGARDRETEAAMTTDTIFAIASMTKPITSFAVMMLQEEGRLGLDDPVADYLPELGGLEVGGANGGPAEREMTVRDLLRHTSGLTYGFFGDSPVDRLYLEAQLLDPDRTLAEMVTRLGALPLKHHPGAQFEYSVSTDVLGRLVEVVADQPFDRFLHQRIFEPLGMVDTGFHVPADQQGRLAVTYARGENGLTAQPNDDVTASPALLSGGGGLFSTAGDYLRFCRMVLAGGELDGVRLVNRETIDLMTSDHLEGRTGVPLGLGVGGFGLGFAYRTDLGEPPRGSVGELNWLGIRSTGFWIDPAQEIIGIYLTQVSPFDPGLTFRFRELTYDAID